VKPIQVAVIILGINRSLSYTHASIEQQVLRPLASSRIISSSVALWLIKPEDNQIVNKRSGENGTLETELPAGWSELEVHHLKMTQLQEMSRPVFAELSRFSDRWNDDYKSLQNLIIDLQAKREVFLAHRRLLKNEPEVTVFLRPDCRFENHLFLKIWVVCAALLNRVGLGTGFFLSWGLSGGINDRFAVLGGKAAKDFFLRVEKIEPENWRQGFHAEEYLRRAMSGNWIINCIPTEISRVRIGGAVDRRDLRRYRKKSFRRRLGRLLGRR
jgi:hypothetical protein